MTTGPCDADGLRAAGADIVLDDLTVFADWLAGYRATASWRRNRLRLVGFRAPPGTHSARGPLT
ncbi:hypothetical protein BOX37_12355 [Nocardia mangyaensis]|uniref:Uncharacterized protein n=1 Tax=Nocardia mangyaensis TaxID=2213200 RepID=A0A1J0VRH8_9NOCA|nr:hypothetical protein [Nocardia mangyaensis]APE34618.1 hypothetical protein BOX37_12355 [Nocardia mangyaensis]